MSRFLKKRHYQLVLPGVQFIQENNDQLNITESIMLYMDRTQVSYTQQDVAEIQTMYLAKYGHSVPPPPPSSSHTPNIIGGGL